MKVFYATQISNNDGKNFILSTDACMNICIGIISEILENDSNISFLIAIPDIRLSKEYWTYYSMFEQKYHSRITFIEFDSPVGPSNTRYHFDYIFWKKQYNLLKECDVMINDQNTLTKNWNTLFYELKLNIPIVSTNYFMDTPVSKKVSEQITYFERQMESFNNSNLTAFQSKENERESLDAYDTFYKNRNLIKKTTSWNIGVWAKEVLKYSSVSKFDETTIYFGNRISDSANRYNNYHKFAEAVGLAKSKTNIPFKAIMLNPTRKVTEEQLSLINTLSNNTVEVLPNNLNWSREDYLTFINRARVSCNLFTNEVHGGVTHCEALIAGNITIMPKVNNYWYKFKHSNNTNYPFFCEVNESNEIEVNSLSECIIKAVEIINTNNTEYTNYSSLCKKIGYDYESYEKSAHIIINDLKELIKNK